MTMLNMLRYTICIIFISFAIILGFTTAVTAAECVVPREIVSARPGPKGTPTNVFGGVYVVDVKEIDDVSQSFSADFLISLHWQDLRLSSKSLGNLLVGCDLDINDIWNPQVRILNRKKLDKIFESLKVDATGNVTYRQRFIGDLSSRLDLREFPFDKLLISISLVSVGHGPDEVSFYVDESVTGQSDSFSIVDWMVKLKNTNITTEYISSRHRNISRFDLQLEANRHTGFYLWKVFFPLTFIVFMAGTVFWIDPIDLPAQIGVSTASIITLIAFQFSLGYLLPRVSYLTRADLFLMGSTLLVFLAMGLAITTSRLAKNGKQELSLKIDRWARVIYPVNFIILSLFSFWI
jgi:hypothetical protein